MEVSGEEKAAGRVDRAAAGGGGGHHADGRFQGTHVDPAALDARCARIIRALLVGEKREASRVDAGRIRAKPVIAGRGVDKARVGGDVSRAGSHAVAGERVGAERTSADLDAAVSVDDAVEGDRQIVDAAAGVVGDGAVDGAGAAKGHHPARDIVNDQRVIDVAGSDDAVAGVGRPVIGDTGTPDGAAPGGRTAAGDVIGKDAVPDLLKEAFRIQTAAADVKRVGIVDGDARGTAGEGKALERALRHVDTADGIRAASVGVGKGGVVLRADNEGLFRARAGFEHDVTGDRDAVAVEGVERPAFCVNARSGKHHAAERHGIDRMLERAPGGHG